MPIPSLHKKSSEAWHDYRSARGISSKPKKRKNWRRLLVKASIILVASIIIIFTAAVAWISRDLPNPNQLMGREIAQSTKIYDRTGQNVLYEISGEERRTLILLKDTPNYVKQATIAIEDKNFYNHGGFSLWAMFRTAITNIIYHRSAGGSTLTQQFIKNAVLSNEKTIIRKVKELIMAYQLEKKFSKDEVLQMYLNEIPYGSNAYGVEAAAQKYFGKSVKDISLAEASVLAALPQSPSRYSPYGPNKDLLLGRKDYILTLMVEQGYISQAEADLAKQQEIVFKGRDNNMTAPHFVMYIKDILAEKYGEKMIEQEGLKIYTTLDLYKQKIAEEIITEKTKDYPKKYGANNAALVSIDPKTGQILAMVGSRDYFDDTIDGQVNVTTRPRQPGSSMKPLVYAALFEKGYTPDTLLYDVVTNFSTDAAQPYIPNNYDGKEHGPISIRQALAGSLNIPAVKAIYLADINNVIDLAENMGYTTLYPRSRFGLSLVLGGGEVKLLEHVNAYSAFARDGQMSPIVSILKVEDKNGRVIEEYKPSEKKVLNSKVARLINSILTDNNARSFIFGVKNFLTLGSRPVGAKTGTTNNFHDAWAIGYTPSLVTGVWVGNSDNTAMTGKADGSVLAAPIWNAFMTKVLGDTPVESFRAPDDYKTGKEIIDGQIPLQTVKIDSSTGLAATSSTPPELLGEQKRTIDHNILFYVDKNDPLGPTPIDPTLDPQFNLWENAVQKWVEKNASSSSSTNPINDSLHRPENFPQLKINLPLLNQTITTPSLEVQVEASSLRGISRTEYFLNNNLWETTWGVPGLFSKDIGFLSNGYQTLKIKTCDDVDNCLEKTIDFNFLIKNNPVNAGKNSLNITDPSSALAVNTTDFPLKIRLTVSKPGRTAKINLVVIGEDSKATIIRTVSSPGESNLETTWEPAPAPGTYSLYGEASDWNGDVLKSNELKISIGQ